MRSNYAFAMALAALVAWISLARHAHAADAGALDRVSGDVTITSPGERARKAEVKERIQTGDIIATAASSEAFIKLVDDTALILRPNTQFKISEFRFDKKPSDSTILSLLRGTLRYVSGLIGKTRPTGVHVTALTSTIGIRGTDFEVAAIVEDSPDARAGVYNYVHDGVTNMMIATGQNLDVKKEQTAFAPQYPKPGEEPLQLLAEPPLFLRQGGGFDALIQSLTRQPINIIHQLPVFR